MMNYPASDLMRGLLAPQEPKGKTILDSTGEDGIQASVGYASADLRLKAAAIVQAFALSSADDLGDDENNADRLMALVVGAVDVDKDGEISEDEASVANVLLDNMWQYMSDKGVSDDDCNALLNEWEPEVADRVKDYLAETIPADDDEAVDDLDSFAFDEEAEQSVFDSAGNMVLDAVYKKKVIVRGGKKVRINKRISGNVRLTAKQKIAVRKMHRKSHSAAAIMKRVKSMRLRRRAGL